MTDYFWTTTLKVLLKFRFVWHDSTQKVIFCLKIYAIIFLQRSKTRYYIGHNMPLKDLYFWETANSRTFYLAERPLFNVEERRTKIYVMKLLILNLYFPYSLKMCISRISKVQRQSSMIHTMTVLPTKNYVFPHSTFYSFHDRNVSILSTNGTVWRTHSH